MSRMLFVSLCVVLALPTLASANPAVVKSMGDLRWGSSETEVERFLERKVREAAREDASKKSQLDQQLRQIQHGAFEFDGGRSRWDSGPVADQFTHDNRESMLVYDDGDSRNYYFFIQGRLWKWYKSYPSRAFGGSDFKRFSKLIEKKFGKGRVKEGELYDGTGEEHRFIEYMTRGTRLRAVHTPRPHGEYALVFEDLDTVRDLPSLRTEVDRRARSRALAERVRDREPEEETPSRATPSRKSIMESEGRDETSAEYAARKKRVLVAEREKQAAIHERKQDRKQGKALDALAGIEDDDPLSGF